MKKFKYKCLDCGHEGVDHRDGIKCPKCKGFIVPTGDAISVDIRVVQKPISVKWECPKCNHENITPYDEFLSGTEYCDWKYETIKCAECEAEYRIDQIDWD